VSLRAKLWHLGCSFAEISRWTIDEAIQEINLVTTTLRFSIRFWGEIWSSLNVMDDDGSVVSLYPWLIWCTWKHQVIASREGLHCLSYYELLVSIKMMRSKKTLKLVLFKWEAIIWSRPLVSIPITWHKDSSNGPITWVMWQKMWIISVSFMELSKKFVHNNNYLIHTVSRRIIVWWLNMGWQVQTFSFSHRVVEIKKKKNKVP